MQGAGRMFGFGFYETGVCVTEETKALCQHQTTLSISNDAAASVAWDGLTLSKEDETQDELNEILFGDNNSKSFFDGGKKKGTNMEKLELLLFFLRSFVSLLLLLSWWYKVAFVSWKKEKNQTKKISVVCKKENTKSCIKTSFQPFYLISI